MERTAEPIAGNGQPSGGDVDPIELSPAVAGLRSEMEALERERAQLQAALDRVTPELRKREKAIAILEGRPLGAGGRPQGPPKESSVTSALKSGTTGISEERLERLTQAILRWVDEHQADEFRQVDIRQTIDFNSGTTAIGFEKLRQAGVIRLARASGNNKYFRLTREAQRKQ
jgi:hypothetical protein